MATNSVSGEDLRLLVQIARLYYLEEQTQLDIAKLLRTSRPRVNRLLRQARDIGIVKIEIRDPSGGCAELEAMLRLRFKLEYCAVASGSAEIARQGMIEAAARFVDSLIQPKLNLAVSWGATLRDVASALPHRTVESLEVVTMAGGFASGGDGIGSNEIARLVAERYGGTYTALNAPAIVQDIKTRNALLREPHIQKALAKAAAASLALVGIGSSAQSATLWKAGYFQEDEFAMLRRQGAVGDIQGRFLDADGAECAPDISRRSLSISLDQIRAIPHVVAVAGGADKAQAMLAALKGGYIRSLVTDEPAASALAKLLRGRE